MTSSSRFPVFHSAIIGAGAGGLFCAGSFNRPKIVLEQNTRLALKVSASGGGKCNFSNRLLSANDYLSQTPHFCKNALAAFTPADFTALLDENRIPYEERENGQLFAFDAREIVRFLISRAEKANTTILAGACVQEVLEQDGLFLLHTTRGPIRAQNVVLASGGISYPQLGGNTFAAKIARRFGLSLVPQRPALCGLVLPKPIRTIFSALAGNSLETAVCAGKKCFRGDLLFTHQGVSGPAGLNASLYAREGEQVTINFLPECDVRERLYAQKNTARTFSAALKNDLPVKITKILLAPLTDDLAGATKQTILEVARRINHFTFIPERTAGYTKAEVTAGGIACTEINAGTMACKKVRGLYVIGEALDVTGRLGGFNLQWAWSSASLAARALNVSF